MQKNIPRDKMSKRQRKELDQGRRVTWEFSPATQKVESKKLYKRKNKRPWQDGWKDPMPRPFCLVC